MTAKLFTLAFLLSGCTAQLTEAPQPCSVTWWETSKATGNALARVALAPAHTVCEVNGGLGECDGDGDCVEGRGDE